MNFTVTYERCKSKNGKNYTRWTILRDGKKFCSGVAKTNTHAANRAAKILNDIRTILLLTEGYKTKRELKKLSILNSKNDLPGI